MGQLYEVVPRKLELKRTNESDKSPFMYEGCSFCFVPDGFLYLYV